MQPNNPLKGVPGWYKSSTNPDVERYWDGKKWTENVRIITNIDSPVTEDVVFSQPEKSASPKNEKKFFTKDRIAFLISTFTFLIITAIIFQGMNSTNPEVTPTFASTPSSSSVKEKSVEPAFVDTASPSEVSSCKLQDQRNIKTQPNNVGFPLTADIIPVQGTADIVVMAVDFVDAPGEGSPSTFLESQMTKMQEWYSTTSEGKLAINFQSSPEWIHVPVPSAQFNIDPQVANSADKFRAIQQVMAQEIISASANKFDWTDVDGVLFQFPSSIQGVAKDLGDRGVILSTPQGNKNLFFWGGGQYHHTDSGSLTKNIKQELTWAFWIHELLHSQGLALHSPGNGIQTSVANNQYGQSLVLDAWETLLLGWIPDEKVFCASKEEIISSTFKLTPLESQAPGKRIGIIKLNDSEALIIESRRASGYSNSWPSDLNGLLVYRINTTLDNDRSQECCGDVGNDPTYAKWGYYLVPEGNQVNTSQGPNLQHLQLVAKQGNKVTYDGIVIELIYSGEQDFVQVTKQ